MIVGYVSGVFDMFHIGHLNIIMQARKHCDRLIVGAVTDEVVTRVKGRAPVIPLAERMEILAGLRDVDEVVVDSHADKFDTWRELRYDVIFKGDDWKNTPKGERLEADLSAVGARVHYFPYTRHTSSSLLRQVVEDLAHVSIAPLPDDAPDTAPDAPDDALGQACPRCGCTGSHPLAGSLDGALDESQAGLAIARDAADYLAKDTERTAEPAAIS